MCATVCPVAPVIQPVLNDTSPQQSCFHCGLPVPGNADYSVQIDGRSQPMCCRGCQAVAQAIVDGGLSDFFIRTSLFDTIDATGTAGTGNAKNITLPLLFTLNLLGDWGP